MKKIIIAAIFAIFSLSAFAADTQFSGNVQINTPTGVFGYLGGVGAGSAVVQTGSATSSVTINTASGLVNTVAQSLAPGQSVDFVVYNSAITNAKIVPTVSLNKMVSPDVGNTTLQAWVNEGTIGYFTIRVWNQSTTVTETQALRIRFFLTQTATN